jgi:hypothetical protein
MHFCQTSTLTVNDVNDNRSAIRPLGRRTQRCLAEASGEMRQYGAYWTRRCPRPDSQRTGTTRGGCWRQTPSQPRLQHFQSHVLVASIDTTHTRMAVTDLGGVVLAEDTIDVPVSAGPSEVFDRIVLATGAVLGKQGLDPPGLLRGRPPPPGPRWTPCRVAQPATDAARLVVDQEFSPDTVNARVRA